MTDSSRCVAAATAGREADAFRDFAIEIRHSADLDPPASSGLLPPPPGSAPYVLLAPGILWLAVFFVPLGFLGYQSLQSGIFPDFRVHAGSSPTSRTLSRLPDAPFCRSFLYAGSRPRSRVSCSRTRLVYWIAFRAGRGAEPLPALHRRAVLLAYLVRTLAWLNILADEGPVVGSAATLHVLGTKTAGSLATTFAVVAGITYNFLPFMALPIYVSLEQIDPRLLEAAKDLYAQSDADVPAGHAAARRRRASSPAPSSRSSRRPGTSSTRSSSARRTSR